MCVSSSPSEIDSLKVGGAHGQHTRPRLFSGHRNITERISARQVQVVNAVVVAESVDPKVRQVQRPRSDAGAVPVRKQREGLVPQSRLESLSNRIPPLGAFRRPMLKNEISCGQESNVSPRLLPITISAATTRAHVRRFYDPPAPAHWSSIDTQNG